jgi:hypothetical protein
MLRSAENFLAKHGRHAGCGTADAPTTDVPLLRAEYQALLEGSSGLGPTEVTPPPAPLPLLGVCLCGCVFCVGRGGCVAAAHMHLCEHTWCAEAVCGWADRDLYAAAGRPFRRH